MPAKQEGVSARVLEHEQPAAMINGADGTPGGNTIASMPRLRPPGL